MNASNLYIKAFRTAREVQSNSRAQTLCQFVRCFWSYHKKDITTIFHFLFTVSNKATKAMWETSWNPRN